MNLIDELLAEASPREQQRVQDRMMLAARIADALVDKGWTQKQLAEQLSKSPSEISKWLSGTHNFTADTLSDLSAVLDVKLLCVKEEAPAEAKKVTVYRDVYVTLDDQHRPKSAVLWHDFQRSMAVSQPNA